MPSGKTTIEKMTRFLISYFLIRIKKSFFLSFFLYCPSDQLMK